jgi:hypothetical protein
MYIHLNLTVKNFIKPIIKPLAAIALAILTIRFLGNWVTEYLIERIEKKKSQRSFATSSPLYIDENVRSTVEKIQKIQQEWSLSNIRSHLSGLPHYSSYILAGVLPEKKLQIDVPGDGNCLFHATLVCLKALNHDKKGLSANKLREKALDHLKKHKLDEPTKTILRQELEEYLHDAQAKRLEDKAAVERLRLLCLRPHTRSPKSSQEESMESHKGALYETVANFSEDMPSHLDPTVEEYLELLAEPRTFAGNAMIEALSQELGVQLNIYGPQPDQALLYQTHSPHEQKIHLINVGRHYNALISC